MSQRNPMNDRYQGEGPVGKTKKSAAKLKLKTSAASSVHIEAKPTNRQERKAAHRRREAEERRKNEERARKAAERERKAREEAGESVPEPKKPSILDKLFPRKTPQTTGASTAGSRFLRSTSSSGSGTTGNRPSAVPTTKQYKDLKRIYWILIGIGVVFVAASFLTQTYYADRMEIWGVAMGAAYVCIIGAIIFDFAKVRPLVKAHQNQVSGGSGKKSPKQIKHQEEAAERARQIEEFNKAKKQARRLSRRQVLGLAPKASGVAGEAEAAEEAEAAGVGDGEAGGASGAEAKPEAGAGAGDVAAATGAASDAANDTVAVSDVAGANGAETTGDASASASKPEKTEGLS